MELETTEQLELMLKEIESWEKEQDDLWFWEKIGRIPFLILDKITPKFIHKKINLILEELGSYIDNGGKYLTSQKQVLKRFSKYNIDIDVNEMNETHSTIPIEIMDRVSQEIRKSHKDIATLQGATTGFGGFITLAIDIPAILGLSLKTLQDIAISYGYDPRNKEERIFIIKCLQFASSDIVGKKAILNDLKNFNSRDKEKEALSQIQGWREVILVYKDNFGWKKLFQMIPIAGMVFGAFINKQSIEDVAEAGIMLYKKRRIIERLTSHQLES
ncbi:EcsC family protein [Chengkuizengella axinellae]|uniref:EcsC family protein n=1 Tax=Chengkuizengella axinellae TaxID=3064388 RepID=A0ABT9ITB1_9BACL|nr:EcsC family protein [Chengkuizengella sp. 2205SS18-9]MDP5272596.1 EcsC family protein [Chengkuizengella sp. 2205SS18-9]